MAPLQTRFIVADDIRPEQTWQLAAWCAAHGATEFRLDLMSLKGHPAPFCDAVETALAPFRRPEARREHMSTLVGQPRVRPTELWTVSAESLRVLQRHLDEGLFTYLAGEFETGWLEDPTFYRDGELMLGVVSHEREGLLRLTELEHAEVAALGIPSRSEPQWI